MYKGKDQDEIRLKIEEELANADVGNRTVPFGTYGALATKYGISREWARRIGERNNYYIAERSKKPSILCKICGKTPVRAKSDACVDCRYVTIKCDNCGKEFKRRRIEAERSIHSYCSRKCLGTNAGKLYGFGGTARYRQ